MADENHKNNFLYWKNEFTGAMRISALEAAGKGLARALKQTDAFKQEEALTKDQIEKLREIYKDRMEKLKAVRVPSSSTTEKEASGPSWKVGDEVRQKGSQEIYVVTRGPSWHLGGSVRIKLKFPPKGIKPVEELIEPEKLIPTNPRG